MSEYAGLKNRLKRVRAPGWPSENPDGAEAVKAIEKLQSQVERLKGDHQHERALHLLLREALRRVVGSETHNDAYKIARNALDKPLKDG